MLYLVGLGLGGPRDVTVRGLEIVKSCDSVYLEAYTSLLPDGQDVSDLEAMFERKVTICNREMVEEESDKIVEEATNSDVALLVIGDPMGATTHSSIYLQATQGGVTVHIIHNASIFTAVGCSGLQLYNFGQTVSIVFWTDAFRPDSFLDKIEANLAVGLHTLCLLDLKIGERTVENMMKNRRIYEAPRYMLVNEAARILLQSVQKRKLTSQRTALNEGSRCLALARLGWKNQRIRLATLQQLCSDEFDLGPPLHSLVIIGNTHELEDAMLNLWK